MSNLVLNMNSYQKIDSHLTNFIVCDLETFNTDRARPYNMTFYRLSKKAGRYKRDPTQEELKKSNKDTIAFVGDKCVSNAFDSLLKFKGEERKVKNKNVEHRFHLHAHESIGFDTSIILNNPPCDKHIVDINKNGKGIISLKIFNGYIGNNKKQIPQNLIFRCGLIFLLYSSKNNN